VPVVVNERLAIVLLGAQYKPLRTMWAQTDGGADDAIPRDVHRRETHGRTRRRGRCRRRVRARRGARCASAESEPEYRDAAARDQCASIHAPIIDWLSSRRHP